MNPHNQQLFVILVHYGDASVTRQALAGLAADSCKKRIVVIDHAAAPFAIDVKNDEVVLIRPRQAGGYAEGVNSGLGVLVSLGAEARDIVVVMNNDVVIDAGALTRAMGWWQEHPTLALVGVKVKENGKVILGGGYINFLTGRATLRQNTKQPLAYIHGAFMMAPYSVWLKSQGLPEEYFMYFEDTAVSFRLKRLGVPLRYAETVSVTHHTAAAPTVEQVYYLVRNGALFMELHTPMIVRWWWWAWNRLRYQYHRRFHRNASQKIAAALDDAIAGRTGRRIKKEEV